MALVVFLRGINVGGHRSLRPSVLASELSHLDVVNVGAAGTLVVRKRISPTKLRAELVRRLPFASEVAICKGEDVVDLASGDMFAGQPAGPKIVRFVSVLAKRGQPLSATPLHIPSRRDWSVMILGTRGQFVFGLYRRHMKTIRYLGQLDEVCGARATTRNWNTITAIARILQNAK